MGKVCYKILLSLVVAVVVSMAAPVAGIWVFASDFGSKVIDAGTTWTVSETTELGRLTIGEGAVITSPEGFSVTLTVDGVETGAKPGVYRGDIVLTPTEENVIVYKELTHHFRQAVYLDDAGIVKSKSVPDAVGGWGKSGDAMNNLRIRSTGENFNGIFAAGGFHTIRNVDIRFSGNGGNDFAGYGAAVMSTGKGTTLVLDGADIRTEGAVRTAVVAAGGSHIIIKNARIQSFNGVLPHDYQHNVTLGLMKEAPWLLGLSGNCRTTNLLGQGTRAAYINSDISAEGWGVLSTDDGSDGVLTAINSRISITGDSGYGAYCVGNDVENFYGCSFDVPDYAVIITRGTVNFGASTPETVGTLNRELQLGLTEGEVKALEERQTTVKSGRFGIMSHSKYGAVNIMDGTIFDCKKTIFMFKGTSADVKVDGSRGARLRTGNGVIFQLMDSDDPGPGPGGLIAEQTYHEPEAAPVRDSVFDVTVPHDADGLAIFSNIELKGDFYNSIGWGNLKGKKNLVLTFDNVRLTGVISASDVHHPQKTIGMADYRLLGEVLNIPQPVVNNGVIVTLRNGSEWTVSGTSYLSRLTIDAAASIAAPDGFRLEMMLDGTPIPIVPGDFAGEIMLRITKLQVPVS